MGSRKEVFIKNERGEVMSTEVENYIHEQQADAVNEFIDTIPLEAINTATRYLRQSCGRRNRRLDAGFGLSSIDQKLHDLETAQLAEIEVWLKEVE